MNRRGPGGGLGAAAGRSGRHRPQPRRSVPRHELPLGDQRRRGRPRRTSASRTWTPGPTRRRTRSPVPTGSSWTTCATAPHTSPTSRTASSGSAVPPTPSWRRRRRLCERCAGKLRFSHIRRRSPLRGTPGQASDIDVRNLNSAPLTGFLPLEYSIRCATVELPIRGSRQSGLRWRSDGSDPARCAGSVRRAFREPLDRPFGPDGPAWMFSMGVMGGVVMGVSTRLAAGSPCRRVWSGVAVKGGWILDSKRLAAPCRHRVAGVWAGGAHRVAGRVRRGGGEPLRREGGRRCGRAPGAGAAARDRRTLGASPRAKRIWLALHRS